MNPEVWVAWLFLGRLWRDMPPKAADPNRPNASPHGGQGFLISDRPRFALATGILLVAARSP